LTPLKEDEEVAAVAPVAEAEPTQSGHVTH
jgi:hypothetical protein